MHQVDDIKGRRVVILLMASNHQVQGWHLNSNEIEFTWMARLGEGNRIKQATGLIYRTPAF